MAKIITFSVLVFSALFLISCTSPVEVESKTEENFGTMKVLEPGRYTTSPDVRDIRILYRISNNWVFFYRFYRTTPAGWELVETLDTLQGACFYDSVQVKGWGNDAMVGRLRILSNENKVVESSYYVRLD